MKTGQTRVAIHLCTSHFFGKAKKSTWDAGTSYPSITQMFQAVMMKPFKKLKVTSEFEALERYTCVIYDKTTLLSQVNDLRKELFSRKPRLIETTVDPH